MSRYKEMIEKNRVDLYGSLAPLLWVLRLIGAFPIARTVKKDLQKTTVFEASKLSRGYTLVPLVMFLMICSQKWSYIRSTKLLNLSAISIFFEYLVSYCQYFGAGILILMSTFRMNQQTALLNNMIELDELFHREFGIATNCQNIRLIVFAGIVSTSAVITLIIFLDNEAFNNSYYEGLFLLPALVLVFGFTLCYGGAVRLVLRWLVFTTEALRQKLGQTNVCDYAIGTIAGKDLDLLALRNIYTCTSNIVATVNEEFGLQIAFAIGASCVALPYYSYYAILILLNDSKIIVSIDNAVWIFVSIVPVIYAAVTCEKVISAKEDLANLVHRAMTELPNRKLKKELNMLSLQMAHDKFEFTAFDLFIVNTDFLSYAKTIFIYMMIMLQFEIQDLTMKETMKNFDLNRSDNANDQSLSKISVKANGCLILD